MSEIESLRQRAEAAAKRFSEMDSLRHSQGERLLALIGEFEQGMARKQAEIDGQQARFAEFEAEKSRLDETLAAQQAEIERQAAEIERLAGENGQLNDLLGGLLATLENSQSDTIVDAVDRLDGRIGGMTGAKETVEGPAAPADDAGQAVLEAELVAETEADAEAEAEAASVETEAAPPPAEPASEGTELELATIEATAEPSPEAAPASDGPEAIVQAEAAGPTATPEPAGEPEPTEVGIEAVDGIGDGPAAATTEAPEAGTAEHEVDVLDLITGEGLPPAGEAAADEGTTEPPPVAADSAPEGPGEAESGPAEAAATEAAGEAVGSQDTEALDELILDGLSPCQPSGKPSTVKKIIQRVSALADEIAEAEKTPAAPGTAAEEPPSMDAAAAS